jgi:aspartyl-tRNA(Asn)/glutamyl-tRNA(Gln) amidotransferase subunit B
MGATEKKVMIGLEVHGYLAVPNRVKLFCDCSLEASETNTRICPVCTAQPGAKPKAANKDAVEAILRMALFLECKTINEELVFQRKHYSWPDLPSGYQRTMSGAYSQPVGLNGTFLGVGIEEIHLEEDPARWDPVTGGVDYNRSGYPLVEIVTKPEFTSAEHAREWLESLMVALSYIKAVRRDLGVKCDVNVSVAPTFIRTEVKNVNSFTAIERAIRHEIKRQQEEPALQQTRAWDEASGTTLFMRSKETALDYMFIPDPDLPVIHVSDEWKAELAKNLPERPDQKQAKFEKLGVAKDVAEKLSRNLYFADAAEADIFASTDIPAEFIANRYINEVAGVLGENVERVSELLGKHNHLVSAFYNRTITNLQYKELLAQALAGENVTQAITAIAAGAQSNDDLLPLVKEAILSRPEAATDVKKGNAKAINAIVGYVLSTLKKDGKSADPAVIQTLIKEELDVR